MFKLNGDATALDYSSYLGGISPDEGHDLALDSEGAVFVVGTTISGNFRTTAGALRTTKTGDFRDGYVVKFGPSGESLLFSTYLGGEGHDEALAVAVDSTGSAHVTGFTNSQDGVATADAQQGSFGGQFEAFLVKLDTGGEVIEYGTYWGGSRNDRGQAVALDAAGRVALTGRTTPLDFPTTEGAYQTSYGGGGFFRHVVRKAGWASIRSDALDNQTLPEVCGSSSESAASSLDPQAGPQRRLTNACVA